MTKPEMAVTVSRIIMPVWLKTYRFRKSMTSLRSVSKSKFKAVGEMRLRWSMIKYSVIVNGMKSRR